MPVAVPGADERWRCGPCGNLTRFDVERTVRAREYVHVDLAGEATVEERTVLTERVEGVVCRWCGARDAVVVEPRPSSAVASSAERRPAGG